MTEGYERPGAQIPLGANVRVRDLPIATHYRTPRYIRGQIGEVVLHCGAFPNPEKLAYGDRDAAPTPLYRVRFPQRAIWPGYSGSAADSLDIELYEPWLEQLTPESSP